MQRFAILAAAALGACGTINSQVSTEIEQQRTKRRQVLEAPAVQTVSPSRVVDVKGKLMPATPVTIAPGDWLREKTSIAIEIRNPTPLSAVVAKFAEHGINIVSDLPLDTITYVGKVNPTDAQTALQAVLGSVGLDYQVDDARRLVLIKPMASRTWHLNIGRRKATYSSDGLTASSGSAPGSTATAGAGTAGTSSGGAYGSSPGGAPGMTSLAYGSQGAGAPADGQTAAQVPASLTASASGTGVVATDDLWQSLAAELSARLSILVPRAMATASTGSGPAAPTPPGSAAAGQGDLYVRKMIGTYALNAETGAITVQAPHWILRDLDAYLTRTQEMYNTDITFDGEVVMVSSNRSDTEGLDIAGFARWVSGKYGAVVANNALGGVTVSFPDAGVPQLTTGTGAAGPLLGLQYRGANAAVDVFNAYLSERGEVTVIQKPMLTTTHGVAGRFVKKTTDYYMISTQQAAAGGTGSAATATQNIPVPVETGTDLRVNPRIDPATGLIRAQVDFNLALRSGTRRLEQIVTIGNTVQSVPTNIPVITRQGSTGEVLMRDGDLIVFGGQVEDNLSSDANGLPGEGGPLSGLLGARKATQGTQTYYFALRVSATKRQ